MKHAAVFLFFSACCLAQIPQLNAPVTTDDQIALFERWVSNDPSNVSSQDLLAGAYIQKTRETSDFGYLDRASKIVDSVLATKKDYEAMRLRNVIELNWHHFAKVVEYTREMTRNAPSDPRNWGSLGDALMEMGQYDEAHQAYDRMTAIKANLLSYNRQAYYQFVTGNADAAIALMTKAVKAGSYTPENVAWCMVELGTLYFKTNRLTEASEQYRKAIEIFPTHQAYAGLGSVQAAQGDRIGAIASYKKAQSMVPMPQYGGALRDLYLLAGDKAEARKQEDLVDLVAKLEAAAKQNANRTLALIYANQERNVLHALELAKADLEVRHDVYTYDALAWVLYKNKRYEEAAKASQQSLKMHTPEALFYYHAGMIAHQLGDDAAARQMLDKALRMNPGFDIGQAPVARKTLAALPPVE